MDSEIGALLKQNRKSRNITLQELSERSGLSVSYLSMLERGLSSPTIANLNRICEALNITLAGLLLSIDQDTKLVRKEDRRQIYHDKTGVLYEAITEGNRHMRGVCMRVQDHTEHLSEKHVADEAGYIVQGSMTIKVENVEYELHEGDTLYIPANTAHSFHNTGEGECISVWFYHNMMGDSEFTYPNIIEKKD